MNTTASDGIHALDLLRQRLSQMSTSIGSLKADLERHEPLPTWSSLQSSAQILSHNLSQLMATIDAHRDFFTDAHAYPLTSFPGAKEPLLNQLLRKRLEPQTEDWLKQHEQHSANTNLAPSDLQQLWKHAGQQNSNIVQSMVDEGAFEDDFTIEERETGIEKVSTGLQRQLGQEDGEDDIEDQAMQNANSTQDERPSQKEAADRAPMALESILRVMSTGKVP